MKAQQQTAAVSHYFRRQSDGIWRCQDDGCSETRDRNGKQPKERHLKVAGK